MLKKKKNPLPPQIETHLCPALTSTYNPSLVCSALKEARLSGHERVGVRAPRSKPGGLGGEAPPPSFSPPLRRAAGFLRQGRTKPPRKRSSEPGTAVDKCPFPFAPVSGRRRPTYLVLLWRLETTLRGPLLVNWRETAKTSELKAALLRKIRSGPLLSALGSLAWARDCPFP